MKWIKDGDKVIVYFEYVDCVKGEVIHTFNEDGSPPEYLIKDEKGNIHQVMHYSRMERLKVKGE